MAGETLTEGDIEGLSVAQTRVALIVLQFNGKEKALAFIKKNCPKKAERAKWGR